MLQPQDVAASMMKETFWLLANQAKWLMNKYSILTKHVPSGHPPLPSCKVILIIVTKKIKLIKIAKKECQLELSTALQLETTLFKHLFQRILLINSGYFSSFKKENKDSIEWCAPIRSEHNVLQHNEKSVMTNATQVIWNIKDIQVWQIG